MIFGLFGRRFDDQTFALYRSIVTEARHPEFYLHYGVPDQITARFDMIVLMVAVVLHRLRAEPQPDSPEPAVRGRAAPTPKDRAQELVDLFFAEMDSAMREMGVGDTSIPKRMKKLASAWNGRFLAYDEAFDDADAEKLAAAIGRNVLTDVEDRSGAPALAAYVLAVGEILAATPITDVLAGRIAWPDPVPLSPRKAS